MRLVPLLLLAAALGGAYHWWSGRSEALSSVPPNANGFVPVVMPEDAAPDTVLILAPVDCPSDAAQRADALARELTRRGIPNARGSSFSIAISNPTDEQQAAVKRAVSIFNGEVPAVFVNGMAKSNPSAAEVVAEFRKGGGRS